MKKIFDESLEKRMRQIQDPINYFI